MTETEAERLAREAHEAVNALKEIVGGSDDEANVAHAAVNRALAAARDEEAEACFHDVAATAMNSSVKTVGDAFVEAGNAIRRRIEERKRG